jgi:acyl-CoA thioester hydrolase
MQPTPEPFEICIQVTLADIDNMQHVNNIAYLRWVQDVAVAHWQHGATAAEQEQWLWVVLRHEIDYKQPALLGDEIVAQTWVGSVRGLKFQRHTEIRRRSDGKLLAKALSTWCPINAKTRRPGLPGEETRRRFSVGEGEPV